MPKHAAILAVNKHLHPVRLATYSSRCGNDPYLALELYKWNLQLSSAFQQVLAITEVALRNTIDEQLRSWNANQPHHSQTGTTHGAHWLIDPARPLNSLTRDSRKSARSHATDADGTRDVAHPPQRRTNQPRRHPCADHLRCLAETASHQRHSDAGFRGRRNLWQQALHHAFPHNNSDPNGYIVADRAARLHGLRNRVSHMEPLLGVNIIART
jgi:hypothetical protein